MANSFGSFFKTAGGGEGGRCKYPTRLDTYGCGCYHDCAYCYAKSLLDFRNNWNPDNPRIAPVDGIRKALDKVDEGTVLRLGGMTDCFQPAEKEHRVTYEAIKAMNERGIGYLIVTKSSLVSETEYMRILDPQLAHVQISVTSTSDSQNIMRERASKPSERLRAAEKLQNGGIDVSLRISPYIPELVDVEVLKASNIRKCLVEFLRVNGFIAKWLEGCGYDTSPYTHKSGGYRHLPLWMKKSLIGGFSCFELSVCEDVDEHYQFWKEAVNANPSDCCNLSVKK